MNFIFICPLSKKKKKIYKELEFTKLEFHKNIKKKQLIFKFMFICQLSKKKKKVVRDSSLPSSSSILQGTQAW